MKRVRIVSDLHVGSQWGLWPPGMRDDGRPYPQNVGQRWLWHHWVRSWAEWPRPHTLIINGDLIDGPQPKRWGRGTMTSDLDLQQRALLAVLEPALHPRPERLYIVEGTEYHEPDRLGVVAQLVGAKRHHQALVPVDLRLEYYGRRLLVGHHPDAGQTLYKGSSLERQVLWALARAAAKYDERWDVLVVSHLHMWAAEYVLRSIVVLTPGWSLQDHRSRKRRRHTWIPDIGWVDIMFEKGREPFVQHHLVPTPIIRAERVA